MAYSAAVNLDNRHLQARWGHVMAQVPAIPLNDAEQSQAPTAFARELEKLKIWFRASRPTNAYLAVGAQQPYYLAYISRNHREVLSSYGALCAELMAAWGRKAGVPAPVAKGHEKCRVGIVSAHIHSHSVWHAFLRGWIEHLEPAQFELQLFHTGAARDAETEWAARRGSQLQHALGQGANWDKDR